MPVSDATFEVTNGEVTITISNATGRVTKMGYVNADEDDNLSVDLDQVI